MGWQGILDHGSRRTLALRLMGIRHQRIDPHCPWQNGRIERFFGTLKPHLRQLRFSGRAVRCPLKSAT